MNQKARTRDELFLLKIYETAPRSLDVDSHCIGRALRHSHRTIENIVRHLAQANFVKKGERNRLQLTPQGVRLVEQLLKEAPS